MAVNLAHAVTLAAAVFTATWAASGSFAIRAEYQRCSGSRSVAPRARRHFQRNFFPIAFHGRFAFLGLRPCYALERVMVIGTARNVRLRRFLRDGMSDKKQPQLIVC